MLKIPWEDLFNYMQQKALCKTKAFQNTSPQRPVDGIASITREIKYGRSLCNLSHIKASWYQI